MMPLRPSFTSLMSYVLQFAICSSISVFVIFDFSFVKNGSYCDFRMQSDPAFVRFDPCYVWICCPLAIPYAPSVGLSGLVVLIGLVSPLRANSIASICLCHLLGTVLLRLSN